MKVFVILSVLITASFATAVDLDHLSARKSWSQQQAISDSALAAYKSDQAQFEKSNARVMTEIDRENRLERTIPEYENDLRNANRQISELEREIPEVEQRARQAESELAEEKQKLSPLEMHEKREAHHLERARERLRRAEDELKEAKAKMPPVEADIATATKAKEGAERELEQAKREHKKAEHEVRRCENEISQRQNSVASWERELANKRAGLSLAQRNRRDAGTNLQNTRDDLRQQKVLRQAAEDQREADRREMARSKADYDRENTYAVQLYDYYQQVLANYNLARQQVVDAAAQLGEKHGYSEASERAPAEGTNTGIEMAKRVGEEAGAKEAPVRQSIAGYRSARSTPGQNPAAYQAGIDEGKALADTKASLEDFPNGYNAAMAASLSSDPPSATEVKMEEVPSDLNTAPQDKGNWLLPTKRLVKVNSDPTYPMPSDVAYRLPSRPGVRVNVPSADNRYLSPSCASVPLPEFESVCTSSYGSAYARGYRSGYESTFLSEYRRAFDSNISASYEAARKIGVAAEYQKGLSQGAKDQGVLDGFAGRISAARANQQKLGAEAWGSYLASGYLLRVKATNLEEGSGDGLFTPGEKISMSVVVDNLGGRAAPPGALLAVAQGGSGVSVSPSPRPLARLDANSRTTLRGTSFANLMPGQAGKEARFQIALSSGASSSASLIAEAKATLHFPLELQAIELSKKPKVGEEVDAKFRFKNLLTTKNAPAEIKIASVPGTVSVSSTELASVEIEPGQQVELNGKVKPGVWVGGNTQVAFVVDSQNLGGFTGSIRQEFPALVEVDRAASLFLYDWSGKEVPSATFDVAAGGTLKFNVQFKFQGKTPLPGPFAFKVAQTSDPGIRTVSGSTVGTQYGAAGPNSTFSPISMQYTIDPSLKGKKGHVFLLLLERGQPIHVLQVFVNIL